MILTFVIDSVKLKWLLQKRRLVAFLPLSPAAKHRLFDTNRLDIIRLKSVMQEYLCHNLFGKRVAGIVYDSFNGVLINAIADVEISMHLGNWGSYDRSKIEFLRSLLEEKDILYIAGAHIGTLSIPLSRCVYKVYAFEANPPIFGILEWNVRLNGRDNIRVFNYALYNKEKDITFYSSKANSGGSKIQPLVSNHLYDYDDPEVVTVSGQLLDNIRRQEELEYPDVIVMDIEGAEFNALLGGNDCLACARLLYIEFVPHHLDNIARVSVAEFAENVLRHFSKMKVVDEVIRGSQRLYEKDAIVDRLQRMHGNGIAADLLFYK